MQKRHRDRKKYFQEQGYTTEKYVIPYLENNTTLDKISLLEIGCGEGGNLLPFLERGCRTVGVDLAKDKISNGANYLETYISNGSCRLIADSIFNIEFDEKFDLIFFRDVIEHIDDHLQLLDFSQKHLKNQGIIFIAFPPWQNPFGGHQQMLNSFLAKIPFIHLLPDNFYNGLMILLQERKEVREELLSLKGTSLSIEYFQELVARTSLKIIDLTSYFINPNYEIKFGLRARKLNKHIAEIKYLRNYVSTTCYAILGKKDN